MRLLLAPVSVKLVCQLLMAWKVTPLYKSFSGERRGECGGRCWGRVYKNSYLLQMCAHVKNIFGTPFCLVPVNFKIKIRILCQTVYFSSYFHPIMKLKSCLKCDVNISSWAQVAPIAHGYISQQFWYKYRYQILNCNRLTSKYRISKWLNS